VETYSCQTRLKRLRFDVNFNEWMLISVDVCRMPYSLRNFDHKINSVFLICNVNIHLDEC